MQAATMTAPPLPTGWFEWLRRELAPAPGRREMTIRLVVTVALVTIISMALQVPELPVSAYMVFFVTKENRVRTALTGVLLIVGATIAIAASLLLLNWTLDFPALRIVTMAAVLFAGMWLSRVFVVGPLGFAIGFVMSVAQSYVDGMPGPEYAVRALLWLWVALVYPIALTVVINQILLPIQPKAVVGPKPAAASDGKKHLLIADAFTNPAHAHFALKVTLAAMTCYFIYTGVDWSGIHTAFITCCFIALESTGATLRKGALRLAGCIVGGLLGFLSIMYLIPQMESITSLVLLVAAVSVLAGWVAAGSERIAYAGLQIAFAFYMCVFQGFAPDTDFDTIRDRLVGIVLGIVVTTLVFRYLWPDRATDRLRTTLAQALRSLAKLVTRPQPQTSLATATAAGRTLRSEITTSLDATFRLAELAVFEEEEGGPRDRISVNTIETLVAQTQGIFLTATSLASEAALTEWQRLPVPVQRAESELRNAVAAQLERTAAWLTDGTLNEPSDLAAWNRLTSPASSEISSDGRASLLHRLATQAQPIGRQLTPG
jgi:hypothetical protein